MFSPFRFMYEDGAGDGSGGGATEVQQAPAAPIIPEDIQRELDELRAFKQNIATKEPEKTPEQVAKEAELEKVNFRRFAVENDLLKDDGFSAYESLKSKADKDLVYSDFVKTFKESNPDSTDEDAKSAFEYEYPIDSDNPFVKARAERALSRDAKDLRTPVESAYTKAQESWKEYKEVNAKYPAYNKFIDDLIKEAAPEKMVLFTAKEKVKDGEVEKDEDISIDVELSKEDFEELSKKFKTPKTFQKYISNPEKMEDLKAEIKQKVRSVIREKYADTAFKKGWELAKGIGTKQGSNVGAEQPFGLVKDQKNSGGATVISLEQSNAKIGEVRQRLGY